MRSARPQRSPTPLPAWLTRPLSRVYAWEVARRNRRWDRGQGVVTVERPVVSVGNLSAGGTGKTPMVRWVVATLQEAGRRPAIAMRGYKAAGGRPGDEEQEHRLMMPGVPVLADPDRAGAVSALLRDDAGKQIDCIVLDDGFQHRRLARDLDIVLVDASRAPDRDALLPLGYLREPPAALSRAHACVLTHAELVDADRLVFLQELVRGWLPEGAEVGVAEHRWTGLRRVGSAPEPVAWLSGRRVLGVCAIGHPEAFLRGLDRAGAAVVGSWCLPDHDPFAPGTVRRLDALLRRSDAEAVVMTAKDLTKLGSWAAACGIPVVIPELGMGWRSGEESIRTLLSSVF